MVVVAAVLIILRLVLSVVLALVLALVLSVADLGAGGARALATVGIAGRLLPGGAVLGVVDLPAQPVGAHALLRGRLVGAHLQGDGGVVHGLQGHLLVVDVPPGARGTHAGLNKREKEAGAGGVIMRT